MLHDRVVRSLAVSDGYQPLSLRARDERRAARGGWRASGVRKSSEGKRMTDFPLPTPFECATCGRSLNLTVVFTGDAKPKQIRSCDNCGPEAPISRPRSAPIVNDNAAAVA